ncbi:fimbria/pilus outer membrane usher protein, partial [Stenotrophomonas maltophilia]|uniref:fimbria/pilus outer membrane usher protein n=1 Tax=Stenotrophomonas maltophilia TaxID=40324 RepID=UPI0016611BFB
TETGFNAAGWMFRSRQSMSADPGGKRLQFQDSYIERSLPRRRALLRLGHVSSANPLFTGIPINGVLLVPESALAVAEASAGALVEGIASSEARVEIHQGGVLLHTTLVPPGPFSLSGFSLRNSTTDLDVTVHEHDGERIFVVPASSFSRATLARPGKTFAAGQLRDTVAHAPGGPQAVVTASTAWRLPKADAVASSGFLLTGQYRAVAIGFDQITRGNAEMALSARLTAASSRMGVGYALDMRANTR